MKAPNRLSLVLILLLLVVTAAPAQAQEIILDFSPADTTVRFTLDATFHTVHGSFDLKHGEVHFSPSTRVISGGIVIDATTGQSGNDSRDRRMHKEILQSAHYSEIVFHPDHVEGSVAPQGQSTVQVHGTFSVHGGDHEITIPVQLEMAPKRWSASARFTVPYVKWGLKNPSTFVLHVKDTVEVEINSSGLIK